MRISGIAFVAGFGGVISGWVLAAVMGAAQPQGGEQPQAEEPGQQAPRDEVGEVEPSSQQQAAKLALESSTVIEGPVLEYSYRLEPGNIRTVMEVQDLFAWVYPEYAVIGALAEEEVMVVPRESLVALRMYDVTSNPRQEFRRMAHQTLRPAPPEAEALDPEPALPDARDEPASEPAEPQAPQPEGPAGEESVDPGEGEVESS
jgi:hypothetical protein